MFNDRYGLTEAVINGRKIETRRVEPICKLVDGWVELGYNRIEVVKNGKVRFHNDKTGTYVEEKTRYAIDEVVTVAQSYKDAGINPDRIVSYKDDDTPVSAIQSPGWTNKMFTKPDIHVWNKDGNRFVFTYLMPHRIRITGIRIERLQEITDESCLREGIQFHHISQSYYVDYHKKTGYRAWLGRTPREAFAALIDKVSGRGTWESNPYVVVYQFELVK